MSESMVKKVNIQQWIEIRNSFDVNRSIGFVPTMGALHKGHLSLIKKSQEENQITLVSIFVNPTQFNDKNDLDKYPSNLDKDMLLLEETFSSDIYLLVPSYDVLYKDDYNFRLSENSFSKELCGKNRPGHFDGVLTVVMKLLNIAESKRAYFGEKDYQQLTLIREMVSVFFMKTKIVAVPTVREKDGLALSSRNALLTAKHKILAPQFYTELKLHSDPKDTKLRLENKGFEVDYIEDRNSRRYGAVKMNNVRLIDNINLREVVK